MKVEDMVEPTQRHSSPELLASKQQLRDIYNNHAASLLVFARRVTGESNLAEDVVQESFVRLYQNLDKLDADRPLRPYLFKIAHHVALRLLQRRKKHRGAELDQHATGPTDGLASDLQSKEQRQLVQLCLSRLAPEVRSLIVLRHLEGLKLTELAEVLQCTERTVRNRLRSAAALFGRELDRRGLDPKQD